MVKNISIIVLLVILAAGVFISGCTSSSTPTTPPSPSPAPSSAPTPPTAGQVAAAGETVFANHCASCHGASGGGGRAPAVIGANAQLAKYNTAQGLLDFVVTTMPAMSPGSLSHQEYLNVVGYLLVQNNYLPADTALVESQLSNISLK